jgi:hypothetical protein
MRKSGFIPMLEDMANVKKEAEKAFEQVIID